MSHMITTPVEEQIQTLLRGTRFADEAEWGDFSDRSKSLREQMTEELRARLAEGKPLRVYLGVDPTAACLHVGHFVPFQKLCQFQKLGHQVIFLIGDYTAMIGDPSGRESERSRLTHKEVEQFAREAVTT